MASPSCPDGAGDGCTSDFPLILVWPNAICGDASDSARIASLGSFNFPAKFEMPPKFQPILKLAE
ncbi:MAG: hypothetical protein ACFBSF_09640 [Leptolyngbyaceae cyanobacterium]